MADPDCGCGHPATSHPILRGNCSGDRGGGRYVVNPPGCDCEMPCESVRAAALGLTAGQEGEERCLS